MVDCGCATPEEAFEGLEDDNDLGSVEDRRAWAADPEPPED